MRKLFLFGRCKGAGWQTIVTHGGVAVRILISTIGIIDLRALPFLCSCSAVGIEMHDKRILTRDSDNLDSPCDILPRNRQLTSAKVQRIIGRIQHLPVNLDMGPGRVLARGFPEGQLVPVDRNKRCVIIFAPRRIRTAGNRRPFRSDRERVVIGNAFPLRINHGFGADRRSKVKRARVPFRTNGPADEAIVGVFRRGIGGSCDLPVGARKSIPAKLGRRGSFFGKFLSVSIESHGI